jgi:hypothetical protein
LLARLDAQHLKGDALSLLDGLVLSRQRFATKSHDHVYGILNLVDLNGLSIESTYEKPLLEAYWDIVQQIIMTKGNLDNFTACKEFDLDDLRPACEKRVSPYIRRRLHGIQIHFPAQLVQWLELTSRLRQLGLFRLALCPIRLAKQKNRWQIL